MQVIFRNTWYSPGGRFRKDPMPQEVPESFRAMIPSTALIIEKADDIVPEKTIADIYQPSHLERDHNELLKADEERAASDAYAKALNDAQAPATEAPVKRSPGRPKKDS